MTREEIEYMLKQPNINTLLYEAELMRREDQERFIKRVPPSVPRDKGVWIHTGNGMWEKVKDKFCDNGLKYEVVMFDNIEESEKLKERSHKIAEMMLLKEYKMFKRYIMLEFYDYLEHNKECTLEEIKVGLEIDIRDYNRDTTLHKWTRARAEIFLLFIDKIRQTYSRLTDESLVSELVEIIENLEDVEL